MRSGSSRCSAKRWRRSLLDSAPHGWRTQDPHSGHSGRLTRHHRHRRVHKNNPHCPKDNLRPECHRFEIPVRYKRSPQGKAKERSTRKSFWSTWRSDESSRSVLARPPLTPFPGAAPTESPPCARFMRIESVYFTTRVSLFEGALDYPEGGKRNCKLCPGALP